MHNRNESSTYIQEQQLAYYCNLNTAYVVVLD